MNDKGWKYIQTGGGCDAYILGNEESKSGYFLMTHEAQVPENPDDIAQVGFYQNTEWVGNGISIFEMEFRFGDFLDGKITIEYPSFKVKEEKSNICPHCFYELRPTEGTSGRVGNKVTIECPKCNGNYYYIAKD